MIGFRHNFLKSSHLSFVYSDKFLNQAIFELFYQGKFRVKNIDT